jgi:hypothetical protein
VSVEGSLSRPALLRARIQIPEHVVHRAFPTETVLLNLETGKYHGLNPVGGRIFEELERRGAVAAAAAVIADEYGQPREEVESDVCDLCVDLAERGLIVVDTTDQG